MDPIGSKKIYFNKHLAPKVDKFSAEELAILIEEGRGLFELTMAEPTQDELAYLDAHPKLRQVVEKW
jgi:hypothetical protein